MPSIFGAFGDNISLLFTTSGTVLEQKLDEKTEEIKQGSYYVHVHNCREMHAKKHRQNSPKSATAETKDSASQYSEPNKDTNDSCISDSDEDLDPAAQTTIQDKDVPLQNDEPANTADEDLATAIVPNMQRIQDAVEPQISTKENEELQADASSNTSIRPEGRDRSISDLCDRLANSFNDKNSPDKAKFKAIKKGAIVKFRGDDDEWHTCEITKRADRATGKYSNAWNIIRDGMEENVDFERDVQDFQVLESADKGRGPAGVDHSESLANQLLNWSTSTEEIMIEESYVAAHESVSKVAKEK